MLDRPTRVVLANDDPIVVEGLRAMLAPYEHRVVVTGVALGDPQIEMAAITDGEADALLRLRTGDVVIDPRLATDAALLAARSIDLGEWPGAHLGLTRREAELLALLGEG